MKINWRFIFEWSCFWLLVITALIAILFVADWLRQIGG